MPHLFLFQYSDLQPNLQGQPGGFGKELMCKHLQLQTKHLLTPQWHDTLSYTYKYGLRLLPSALHQRELHPFQASFSSLDGRGHSQLLARLQCCLADCHMLFFHGFIGVVYLKYYSRKPWRPYLCYQGYTPRMTWYLVLLSQFSWDFRELCSIRTDLHIQCMFNETFIHL